MRWRRYVKRQRAKAVGFIVGGHQCTRATINLSSVCASGMLPLTVFPPQILQRPIPSMPSLWTAPWEAPSHSTDPQRKRRE